MIFRATSLAVMGRMTANTQQSLTTRGLLTQGQEFILVGLTAKPQVLVVPGKAQGILLRDVYPALLTGHDVVAGEPVLSGCFAVFPGLE